MTPAAEDAARDLLKRVLHLKALCDHEPGVVPFGKARAVKDVCDAADRFDAKLREPLKITPWSPWNARNTPPDYTPGGAL